MSDIGRVCVCGSGYVGGAVCVCQLVRCCCVCCIDVVPVCMCGCGCLRIALLDPHECVCAVHVLGVVCVVFMCPEMSNCSCALWCVLCGVL